MICQHHSDGAKQTAGFSRFLFVRQDRPLVGHEDGGIRHQHPNFACQLCTEVGKRRSPGWTATIGILLRPA